MLLRKNGRSFIRWQAFALLATLIVWAMRSALAQESTGKIIGTVPDQKGAVVPDARIIVTDVSTKIGRETTTDKDGNFQVISLPIGSYRVTAEKQGFKKALSDEQKLLINQSLGIDMRLDPG